ncbi:MAG TPA: hypothetical protein VLK03_13975 [Nocardioides sp.]|nr:hypothetical protein [Nocardioides sp.]
MTPLVKTLLAVALVIPLVAYVAGSLAGTGEQAPERQGTVYIDDVQPARDTTPGTSTTSPGRTGPSARPTPRPPAQPSPTDSDDQREPEQQETGTGEARVVTPTPVGGDDDDDDDDDERDDDRDDTDDRDDSDD